MNKFLLITHCLLFILLKLMVIRRVNTGIDKTEWLRMRMALWPDGAAAEFEQEMAQISVNESCAVFVCERPGGGLCGFLEISTRYDYVEGCETMPVGYMEGWYVDEDMRRQNIGGQLFTAGERWAIAQGLSEIGSDTWLGNEASIAAHVALGYEEIERLVHFRKQL